MSDKELVKKPKTFTEDEHKKEITRIIEAIRAAKLHVEFKKGCSPLGGSAIPYVEFKVSGGDQKIIDKLALEINTLIMSSLLEESGAPGD